MHIMKNTIKNIGLAGLVGLVGALTGCNRINYHQYVFNDSINYENVEFEVKSSPHPFSYKNHLCDC